MELRNVEIFAVGTWNGTKIKHKHLEEMAANHATLSSKIRVPLKFGHNEEQPITDGQPALGWVTNLQVDGRKLLADFENVPPTVFAAIQAHAYDRVSAEVYFGVEIGGKRIGAVLRGVALLGADLPAVSDLAGLNDLIAGANVTNNTMPEIFTFELDIKQEPIEKYELNWANQFNHNLETIHQEKTDMDDIKKLQDQLDALTMKYSDQTNALTDAVKALEKVEDEKEKQAFAAKIALFVETRDNYIEKVEKLVADGNLTPAIRQKIEIEAKAQEADFSIESGLKFSADILLEVASTATLTKGEDANGQGTGAEGEKKFSGSPDEEIDALVVAHIAKHPDTDFSVATDAVFSDEANADVVQRYNEWTDNLGEAN